MGPGLGSFCPCSLSGSDIQAGLRSPDIYRLSSPASCIIPAGPRGENEGQNSEFKPDYNMLLIQYFKRISWNFTVYFTVTLFRYRKSVSPIDFVEQVSRHVRNACPIWRGHVEIFGFSGWRNIRTNSPCQETHIWENILASFHSPVKWRENQI